MNEFSDSDLKEWLMLSINKSSSIHDAIRYTYFFEGNEKINRAWQYALSELKLDFPKH